MVKHLITYISKFWTDLFGRNQIVGLDDQGQSNPTNEKEDDQFDDPEEDRQTCLS